MVPLLRLNISPLLRADAVTLTLVPGHTRTSPPRSSLRLAGDLPAATLDPLATCVPPAARIAEPLTLASVANTSPIDRLLDCWAQTSLVRGQAANSNTANLVIDMKCNHTAECGYEESSARS